MKLVIGLGNPDIRYRRTRHNIGFRVADYLASELGFSIDNKKFNSFYTKISHINSTIEDDLILLKPQTYMNLSGKAVISVVNFFNIENKDILVIHDDLELEFSKYRFKDGGGLAGHNGLRSIASFIGKDFKRLRVGISRPKTNISISDYVLSNFSEDEEIQFEDYLGELSKSILTYLREI